MPLSDRVTIYILIVQIQPKKHVLDHAGHTGRTPQNMGYHHNDQEIYLSISVLKYLDHEVGIDYTDHLSEVCTIIGVLLFLRAQGLKRVCLPGYV